jgi:hypothetical protein
VAGKDRTLSFLVCGFYNIFHLSGLDQSQKNCLEKHQGVAGVVVESRQNGQGVGVENVDDIKNDNERFQEAW